MDIVIPEILKENVITFGIGLTVALVGVAVQLVKSLIDFYEEVLIKRYFKRLNSLTEHLSTESTTCKYLDALKENEIFRLASGIKASPEKTNMLMKIYLLGIVSNSELEMLSLYLKPQNMKVSIEVNWFDKFRFIYSLLAATFLLLSGIIMGSPYFVMGKGIESIAGLVIMIVFIFIAAIVGRDYRTYRVLKRVRERLIELNMVDNPDKSIQWDINRWFSSLTKKLS